MGFAILASPMAGISLIIGLVPATTIDKLEFGRVQYPRNTFQNRTKLLPSYQGPVGSPTPKVMASISSNITTTGTEQLWSIMSISDPKALAASSSYSSRVATPFGSRLRTHRISLVTWYSAPFQSRVSNSSWHGINTTGHPAFSS